MSSCINACAALAAVQGRDWTSITMLVDTRSLATLPQSLPYDERPARRNMPMWDQQDSWWHPSADETFVNRSANTCLAFLPHPPGSCSEAEAEGHTGFSRSEDPKRCPKRIGSSLASLRFSSVFRKTWLRIPPHRPWRAVVLPTCPGPDRGSVFRSFRGSILLAPDRRPTP